MHTSHGHRNIAMIATLANRFARRVLLLTLGGWLLVAAPSGCTTHASDAPGARAAAAKPDDGDSKARAAQDALGQLMRAYQSGEPAAIEPFLDPAMIGMQSLLEAVRDTQAQQKQIRISLKDIQVTTGMDLAVIRATWEKRYLALPGMTPRLATGHASFAMSHAASGWRLTGVTGDNVFAAYAK
jgi:hypothetical protein